MKLKLFASLLFFNACQSQIDNNVCLDRLKLSLQKLDKHYTQNSSYREMLSDPDYLDISKCAIECYKTYVPVLFDTSITLHDRAIVASALADGSNYSQLIKILDEFLDSVRLETYDGTIFGILFVDQNEKYRLIRNYKRKSTRRILNKAMSKFYIKNDAGETINEILNGTRGTPEI